MTDKRKPSARKRGNPTKKKRAPRREAAPPQTAGDPAPDPTQVPPEVDAAFETWTRVRGDAPGPLFLSDEGLEKLGKGQPVTDADGLSREEVAKILAARARYPRSDKGGELEAGGTGDA